MYKELKKFATGEKLDGIGVFPDKQEIKITYDEYQANLGDLIDDFIKHKTLLFFVHVNFEINISTTGTFPETSNCLENDF